MRTALLLLTILFIDSAAIAGDSVNVELGGEWRRVSGPDPIAGWSWRTWRNERGETLTIANHAVARTLTSHGDRDRAMDFASSAYPQWVDATEFPTWMDGDAFEPQFLKLKQEFTRHPTKSGQRIPIVSYIMVNDNSDRPLMAIGTVVCIGSSTYYVQHNSTRPISARLVTETLGQVVKRSVSTPQ